MDKKVSSFTKYRNLINEMIEKYPFYLLFFALNYSFMKTLPVREQIIVPIILFVLEIIVFLFINQFTQNIKRSGFLTFLLFTWALYFGIGAHLLHILLNLKFRLWFLLLFLIPWSLAFIIIGSKWLWCKGEFPKFVTTYLNLVMVALSLFSGYNLIRSSYNTINHRFFNSLKVEAVSQQVNQKSNDLPDIYYIILDEYGRQDTLSDYLKFDNSWFIEYLESRGFFVAEQSQSNYPNTLQSVSSSLNMNYINPISVPTNVNIFIETDVINNQARNFLEAKGYKFTTFYTPYVYLDIKKSDLYIPRTNNFHTAVQRMKETLLPGTIAAVPIEAKLLPTSGTFGDYQEYIFSSLEYLSELSKNQEQNFVFFHILPPHSPFIFDEKGPVNPDEPFFLFKDDRLTIEEQKQLYPGQAYYMSKLMEITIDKILNVAGTPPIIIIQGDHGPGIYLDEDGNPANCLRERTSILNAYYLPDSNYELLYQSITPVNTFRIIFNQYFGENFELLDDRIYYRIGNFNFKDITEESKIECRSEY
jgi:hypothetical protein